MLLGRPKHQLLVGVSMIPSKATLESLKNQSGSKRQLCEFAILLSTVPWVPAIE